MHHIVPIAMHFYGSYNTFFLMDCQPGYLITIVKFNLSNSILAK